MKRCLTLSVLLLTVLALSGPVHAEDAKSKKTAETAAPAAEDSALVPVENPYMDKIRVKAARLSKNLDPAQLLVLQDVRAGFGMVGSVRMVLADVGNAARLCAENLSDLSDEMTSRHKSWEGALSAALDKSDEQIDALVESDLFGKEGAVVKDYLELTDKAAQFADSQLEKSIVTNEKSCKALLKSMGKTEEQLVSLLGGISWPDPEAALEAARATIEKESAPLKTNE